MPKQGEMTFLGKIGEAGLRHALHKPFSDVDCHEILGEIATLLRLLPKPPGRLLDMGCGTGWTSVWFARRGYDVLGIDISREMISAAEEFASKENLPNLRFLTCDYENLPIWGEYDCAVFYQSLHHAEDETAALRSVYDALKPAGVCVTCEPGDGHAEAEASLSAVERFGTTEKDMPPRHILRIAKEVGFRDGYAFPMLTANLLRDYVWPHQEPTPSPRPRRGMLDLLFRGPIRELLDWVARRRFNVTQEELHLFRHFAAKWDRVKNQGDGYTVLVK